MSYELGYYVERCAGVAPWTIGEVYRRFRKHEVRLDILATAFLVQQEHPGDAPRRLWSRTIKRWARLYRSSLGITGRGGCDVRVAVDVDCDLSHVVAGVYEESLWKAYEEQERVAQLVVTLLDSLQKGLGSALRMGMTVEQAASSCGCSTATAYRRVDAVREMLAS